MGYEVIRPDGRILTRLDTKPIDLAPDGSLHRLVGFTLEGAGEGEYRIEGEVVDEQTGQALLFDEPFTARSPEPARGGQAPPAS